MQIIIYNKKEMKEAWYEKQKLRQIRENYSENKHLEIFRGLNPIQSDLERRYIKGYQRNIVTYMMITHIR